MKRKLDMDRIAEGLGAERRGNVSATGGYFGAMQLLADVEAKFRVPAGGGRPTDPRWTERRLVPLALKTLERLEDITAWVRKHGGINLEPMQLAALILEKTTSQLSEGEDRGPPCAYRKRGACTALGSGGRRNRIGSAIPTPSCIQHSGRAAQPSTHGAARAKLLALSRTLGSTPSAFRRTLW